MTNKHYLFRFLPVFIFLITLFGLLISPSQVFAGAKNTGYITDTNGEGKNGAIVQAEVFQCIKPPQKDEDDDPPCIGLKPYQIIEVETKNDSSGKAGYYEFMRKVPVEGEEDKFPEIYQESGMIGCEQTYFYLNVKMPGSQDFVRISSLNSTLDPISKKPISDLPIITDSKVQGVSTVLAADPPGQKCEDKKTSYPCGVANNIAVMCEKTEVECRPIGSPSPSPSIIPSPSPSPVPSPSPSPLPPSPSPSPTPEPVCNSDCTKNPKYCVPAKDGCVNCIANPGGGSTCQSCPPDTKYNPVTNKCEGPRCDQPCNPSNNTCEFNSNGPVCNFCNPTTSKCEVCPAGSEFNSETKKCDFQNACKCDGLTFSPSIFPGQLVRFTATSKIEGPAIKNATQKYIVFKVFEPTTGDNQAKVLAQSGFIIPTKIEDSATRKRYTATWDYRIPFNIKYNATYRIIAYTGNKIDGQALCEANPITTQVSSSQNTAVLGATATSCGNLPTWLCNIADAWKCSNLNLFKDQSAKDYCTALDVAKQTPSNEPNTSSALVQTNGNLQLDQLAPAKTEKDGCSTILFKFDTLK